MGALERDEFLRATWRIMVAEQVEPERLVFVDEMGTNISLSPLYAWAPKGERIKELIEGQGCQLVYLPSYSPDFNPIEQAFREDQGARA